MQRARDAARSVSTEQMADGGLTWACCIRYPPLRSWEMLRLSATRLVMRDRASDCEIAWSSRKSSASGVSGALSDRFHELLQDAARQVVWRRASATFGRAADAWARIRDRAGRGASAPAAKVAYEAGCSVGGGSTSGNGSLGAPSTRRARVSWDFSSGA